MREFDKYTQEVNKELAENYDDLNSNYIVELNEPIVSKPGIINSFKLLVKKIVRKLTLFNFINYSNKQNKFNAITTNILNQLIRYINVMKDKVVNSDTKFNDLQNQLNSYEQKYSKLEESYNIILEKITLLEEKKEKLKFNYYDFEEKYRGSEEDILNRISIYLEYFMQKTNVLEIGCGRGELISLLINNNIPATGIDINESMVQHCRDKGLPVYNRDAIEYLNQTPDNSLGGLILIQVIEHLDNEYLLELINLAYKKLSPGAYFIAETINPQSLIVFTESYFLDLTHVKMIHPYTIRFLLENEGFSNVELKYISDVGDELKIPNLIIDSEVDSNIEIFNDKINNLNNLVYGARDYYVMGQK